MPRLNVCGLTRLLFPAYLVALAVATIAGSDGPGLLAFAVTFAGLFAWQRARGTTATCALPPAPRTAATTERQEVG